MRCTFIVVNILVLLVYMVYTNVYPRLWAQGCLKFLVISGPFMGSFSRGEEQGKKKRIIGGNKGAREKKDKREEK